MGRRGKENDGERALAARDNMVRAIEGMNEILRRHLLSFELSAVQFDVLRALLRGNPTNQAALSEKLFCNHSNMRYVFANLERRGLIFRRGNSRGERGRMIHLSPAGRKLAEEAFLSHARIVKAQMGALNNREQHALIRMCAKLGGGSDPVRFVTEVMREVEGLKIKVES
jgi:MarR family transcriptional regulator, organic hydroperoxide resistance regulator